MRNNHDPLELNHAVPGGRVEIYAGRDKTYPGGWFYRFQYYHPDEGEILRYDNAHDDPKPGPHHRHTPFSDDTAITFHGISAHVMRFLYELTEFTKNEELIDD